jgi:hypothetical protein
LSFGIIFGPLELRQTTYPTSSRITGSDTHGYFLIGKPPLVDVTAFSPTLFGAAGAILSSADDVARFYRALLSGRLLEPDLLKAMETIGAVATGGVPDSGILGGGWGLGLLRETFPCGQAWGHDAENPGYMTAAWSSKDGSRQIVVVVNSIFSHDAPVSRAMRSVLTKGVLRALKEPLTTPHDSTRGVGPASPTFARRSDTARSRGCLEGSARNVCFPCPQRPCGTTLELERMVGTRQVSREVRLAGLRLVAGRGRRGTPPMPRSCKRARRSSPRSTRSTADRPR